MSNCFAEEVLRRYLEQQLSTEEASALETHVEACPHCEAALARLADVAEARQPWLFDAGETPASAPERPVARAEERPDAGAVDPGADTGPHTGWSDADTAWVVALLEQDGRYQVDREIGRGGMGVVLRGRDLRLGRDLAFKVLRQELRGQKVIEQRFVREAQVCSQLQHPGIVPVYETGYLADGLPYFTMKLVEGQTLAGLLKKRTEVREDLDRWLRVFVQVCLAVARAHSKGVLHRDLKPGNIMVGAFEEVQVMDWGMAKVRDLAAGHLLADPEAETVDRPVELARPAEATRTGMQMGTLAYMAPEQARGEVDRLDARCDVFGLGAILCEILTGAPPYRGPRKVVEKRAVAADLGEALSRLDESGADPELVALARRCLAVEPGDRPADAGVVARAVNVYLSGVQERLRRTELERAAAEARVVEAQAKVAAERRARRFLLGLAAALLLLVLVGGGVGLWWREQQEGDRARRREASEKAGLALERGRSLLEEGWRDHDLAKLRQAVTEAERAVDVAVGAEEGERERAAELRVEAGRRLEQAGRTRTLLVALLEVAVPGEAAAHVADGQGGSGQLAVPSVEDQYRSAFRTWGLDVDGRAEPEAVARLRGLPPAVREEVLAGLDGWMLQRRVEKSGKLDWRRLRRLADGADDNENSRQLRALLCDEQRPDAPVIAGLLGTLAGSAAPWAALAEPGRATRWRLAELRARSLEEGWPALSVALLARASRQAGDAAGAEAVLRQALARRPGQVVLLDALGRLLAMQSRGRMGEAIECFRAARAVQPLLGEALALALRMAGRPQESQAVLEDLIRRQPNHAGLHFSLGNSFSQQKQFGDAVKAYSQAVALRPDYPEALTNLGRVLIEQKDLVEAVKAVRRALGLRPDLPEAHNNLGMALARQQDPVGAAKAFRKALDLRPDFPAAYNNLGAVLTRQKKLVEAVEAFSKAIQLQPDLPGAHYNLGNALRLQNKLVEAVKAYRRAIELQPDYAFAYRNLGMALAEQKDPVGAAKAFRKAIDLRPDYAGAYINLGITLSKQGHPIEALKAHRKAIELQPDLPEAHGSLGLTLAIQRDLVGAVKAFRKAIELRPDYPEAYVALGEALREQKKFAEAVKAQRRAIELRPNYAEAHDYLGKALYEQKELGEAVKAYRRAIELRPDYSGAHYNLGNALRDRKEPAEAIKAYRRAIELRPDFPEAHCNLGLILRDQGRFGEALASLRRGHELGSKRPGWKYPSELWVKVCQRLVELDRQLPDILAGKKEPTDPADLMAFARFGTHQKERFVEVAELFQRCFVRHPDWATGSKKLRPRYYAAVTAAMAARRAGLGSDRLDEAACRRWREQARRWLRAELDDWAAVQKRGDTAELQALRKEVHYWQEDGWLSGVRDKAALAKLPDAERQAWAQLWADVAALLKRAQAKPLQP
jgi:tetratricopeptide (TPR) repeat protein